MKKALLITAGIIVLLVIGFFALNSYIYNEKQGDNPEPAPFTGS